MGRYILRENSTFDSNHYQIQRKGYPISNYMFSDAAIENTSTTEWWKSYGTQLDPVALKFILRLMTASSSTASLERLFSTFGFVQSEIKTAWEMKRLQSWCFCTEF